MRTQTPLMCISPLDGRYINKVENIYIENLAIPLAKNIKLQGAENVLIGSVFNSNLHLVK